MTEESNEKQNDSMRAEVVDLSAEDEQDDFDEFKRLVMKKNKEHFPQLSLWDNVMLNKCMCPGSNVFLLEVRDAYQSLPKKAQQLVWAECPTKGSKKERMRAAEKKRHEWLSERAKQRETVIKENPRSCMTSKSHISRKSKIQKKSAILRRSAECLQSMKHGLESNMPCSHSFNIEHEKNSQTQDRQPHPTPHFRQAAAADMQGQSAYLFNRGSRSVPATDVYQVDGPRNPSFPYQPIHFTQNFTNPSGMQLVQRPEAFQPLVLANRDSDICMGLKLGSDICSGYPSNTQLCPGCILRGNPQPIYDHESFCHLPQWDMRTAPLVQASGAQVPLTETMLHPHPDQFPLQDAVHHNSMGAMMPHSWQPNQQNVEPRPSIYSPLM